MIYTLSTKYQKHIAAFMLLILYASTVTASWGSVHYTNYLSHLTSRMCCSSVKSNPYPHQSTGIGGADIIAENKTSLPVMSTLESKILKEDDDIGGPTQPEMSSFKPVDASNMVNLFTGDFSYNIPLLDVGGYPVNIFYDGNITPEQEASWVGLGWNINPGTITRNMRGVPDDFEGDEMIQTQGMKPNKTWGVTLGEGFEFTGIEGLGIDFSKSYEFSYNNYLGPAIAKSLKAGISYNFLKAATSEKTATDANNFSLGASASVSTTNSSRYGFTTSVNASLSASLAKNGRNFSTSLGLATSYNSRVGIRSLEITDQVSFAGGKDNWMGNVSKMLRPNFSTSITFAKPSYIPAIRMPITNKAGSGKFKIGEGLFGVTHSYEISVSAQKSFIANGDRVQKKTLYGYFNFEKANGNKNAVLDFTRLSDKEVTPNTPVISAPQYTYDVFSISGEGTGGSIRAYRNDIGYVRDNETRSKDESWSAGVDINIPGHFGANFTDASTPSYIGEWRFYNKLRTAVPFKSAHGTWENLYFRNPGENSVLNTNEYDKIGGTDLVRYKIAGTNELPSIEPILEKVAKDGTNKILAETPLTLPDNQIRKKRSQVINFFSAKDASIIGLDKTIKSYNAITPLTSSTNNLDFVTIPRVGDFRKAHHISQINVNEADGKRYIYGIPVYNTTQIDFTFTTASSAVPDADNHVDYRSDGSVDDKKGGNYLNSDSYEDGYVQSTTTPAYAHSFLLSGLLSPDYVDVTGDGITEDDLGNAVKFNYTKIDNENYKWRAPYTTVAKKANYNPGNKTENKDNKGLISYGERESWYTHSIESKTMIAIFTLGYRDDGKSVLNEDGGVDANSNALRRLDKIDLYSKADLKANGITGAKAIKTVHFDYSYDLCKNTPDNKNGNGKLTLTRIYFTFNGIDKVNKNQYVFGYGNINDADNNPTHKFNNSDRWGFCKPNSLNPAAMPNNDYPYTCQDKLQKNTIDKYAAAWNLKSILLPSGGQIDVDYEADDYAFVQDKRATKMTPILGFGNSATVTPSRTLYDKYSTSSTENNFVFIKVDEPCGQKEDVNRLYLQGQKQLSFKLMVEMPKGNEYLTAYGEIEDYGVTAADNKTIWVKLKNIDGYSPLALVAAEYLREQLPGQTYLGYDISDNSSLEQIGIMLVSMMKNSLQRYEKPMSIIRGELKARVVETSQSFVRLNVPDGRKYGGGNRVKRIQLKDNWDAMTGQYISKYGQDYDYTTTEIFNGNERTISSGVASYEPGIGGEENPFQSIMQISNSLPAGPTSYGSVEMPILDALFPAPGVGYSKVTVRSLKRNLIDPNLKSHSGVGKQVTEFYTAKDFPVKYYYTALDPSSTKEAHDNNGGSFFWSYGLDAKALSQGFYIETNDMHGKMKSQASYPENDENTPINFTQNFYTNTGKNEMNDKLDFVSNSQSGTITKGNTGIDIELFTDTREFTTVASSMSIQGQADWFPFLAACCWIPFIWGTDSRQDNIYKAVTCTKTVNYHSVLDRVVVIDKGSTVSTQNLVYDAETGQVVVNRTQNEFNDYIYNTTYPAYWAYSGMGLAYKNIDAVYKGIDFLDGRIVPNANIDVSAIKSVFESGDEIYLINNGENPTDVCGSALATPIPQNRTVWVFDADKNTSNGLTNSNVDHNKLYFIDDKGQPFTKNNISLRIVRSGKRNMLGATVQSITSMKSPIVADKLDFTGNNKVVGASEIEYKEKWQTDKDAFKRYELVVNTANCTQQEVEICDGYLEKGINPYCRGLLGTFRNWRSKVLYTNRAEINPTAPSNTNIASNGFVNNFVPYWNQFNSSNNLINTNSSQWIENSQITRINARGQELETKNALNIYTAAQYGYKKNLPLAIVNNSKTEEMFYEGFEDINYNGNINNDILNCQKQHFGFDKVNNAFISDTPVINSGFKAHTGNSVLTVLPTTATQKSVIEMPIVSEPTNIYDLKVPYSYLLNVPDYGYLSSNTSEISNLNTVNYLPIAGTTTSTSINNSSTNSSLQYSFSAGAANPQALYFRDKTNIDAYFNITNEGLYDFVALKDLNFLAQEVPTGDACTQISGSNCSQGSINSDIDIKIKYLDGSLLWQANNSGFVYLNKGTYKVSIKIDTKSWVIGCGTYLSVSVCGGSGGDYTPLGGNVMANINFNLYPCGNTSNPVKFNKTTNTTPQCPFSGAVASSNDMMNPLFAVTNKTTEDKKMLFSAWVREKAFTNSCSGGQVGYCKSNITVEFYDATNTVISGYTKVITPNGNIIDGWQRIEEDFAIPPNAVTMKLYFNNLHTSNPNYWDDIRIHPYNANMKSYVYDPISLRLVAELDENNYAKFYEYDEEGTLIRTKAETKEGIKTIVETRSAKQKTINSIIP